MSEFFRELDAVEFDDVEFFLLTVFSILLVLLIVFWLWFFGEPIGEIWGCTDNSFLRVTGVLPAVPVDMGELGPFFDPAPLAPLDRPEALRKATRDGDKFVGEELIFRLGFDAIIGLVLFALYFPEKI